MYYRVSLYKYSWVDNKSEVVKDIIVKKGVFSATEIFTNTKFPKISQKVKKNIELLYNYDFLYVCSSSFSDNKIVSLNDVEKYIDNFDIEKFNRILKDDYNYRLNEQKGISKYLKSRSKGVGKNE